MVILSIAMRVRLLTKYPVEDFADNHANGRKHFNKWLIEIKYADWEVPEDLIKTYTGFIRKQQGSI